MSDIIQFPIPKQEFRPPPEPEIYLNDAALPDELWRSVDIALLAAEPLEELLFQPMTEQNWGGQWQNWIDGTFSSLVAPHLVEARHAASQGVLELAAADLKFDEQLLDDEARKRSIAAGLQLLNRLDGATHIRRVEKLRRQLEIGACRGHAASLFALHSALFSIPITPTIIAYALFEWRSAQKLHSWPKVEAPRLAFEQMTPNLSGRLQNWLHSGSNNTFQPRAAE